MPSESKDRALWRSLIVHCQMARMIYCSSHSFDKIWENFILFVRLECFAPFETYLLLIICIWIKKYSNSSPKKNILKKIIRHISIPYHKERKSCLDWHERLKLLKIISETLCILLQLKYTMWCWCVDM